MTPTGFYCWLYDQPLMWLGISRLSPRPEQNFPLGLVFAFPVLTALWITVMMPAGSGPLIRLAGAAGMVLYVLGVFLLSCLTVHVAFAALAWNQRAARVRSGTFPASPTAPARSLRWTLGPIYLLLISLVTPGAMLLGIENVRGALAWREARAALVAKGERLTFRELLPTPVPADQNFASLPLFANLFDYTHPERAPLIWGDTNAQKRLWVLNLPDQHLPNRKSGSGPIALTDWAVAFRTGISNRLAKTGKPDPDAQWQPAYVAAPSNASPGRVVLTALSVADPVMKEICEFSERPHAQFPVHWEENFNALLPHLAAGKGISRHLALRVEARLAEGDVTGAFTDQLCGIRVAGIFREEPLLISQLVRIAQGAIAATSLWPGIRQHQWTDAQLAEFQRRLVPGDYLKNMAWALEGERAGAIAMLDRMVATGYPNPLELGSPESFGNEAPASVTRFLFPRGWIRQNETRIAQFHQRMIEFARGLATNHPPTGWSSALRTFRSQSDASFTEARSPHNLLYQMLAPALDKAISKAVRAEQAAQSAVTACALERYWKKHGAYPESLNALVPEFAPEVPRDLMDGQPLRYRRTADGLFQLWSVGLDGADNGGVAKAKDAGAEELGLDWVWPY